MTPSINALVAREHAADLRRDAERQHANPRSFSDASSSAIELRLLGGHEADVVRRLAELDDAAELEGEILVALIDGRAVAALSLEDRRVVANPFTRTSDAVALLRLRAAQLPNGRGRPPSRLRRHLRLARA